MLIVNFQKIKEIKKKNNKKLIDNIIAKASPQRFEVQKIEKLNLLQVKKLKIEIKNFEKDLISSSLERYEKRFNKFNEQKEEDFENVLAKLMRKIGSHRKKPLSHKNQIDFEITLNKLTNLRKSI